MDIRKLKYFVAVVEAGSFTKAAAQLHIAQSALSLHVRQLEERYGTLLVRDKDGVRTTERGAKLLSHAASILHHVDLAEADLTSDVGRPAGDVTIGIPSGAARVMVASLLAASAEANPLVSLKISEGMTGQIEEWMTAGRLDLAILYRSPDNIGRNVELAREDLYLVAHPEMPPFEPVVALAEIQRLPLAVPTQANSLRQSFSSVAARLGYQLDVRYEVDSLSSIVRMVSDSRSYSILTLAAIHSEVHSGLVRAIKIVNPSITRSVVLMTNPRDEHSLAVLATRSVVIEVVRALVASGDWPASLTNQATQAIQPVPADCASYLARNADPRSSG
jgi:LysR family transcriptional regulator, nitrogen assimilation regulatory protein